MCRVWTRELRGSSGSQFRKRSGSSKADFRRLLGSVSTKLRPTCVQVTTCRGSVTGNLLGQSWRNRDRTSSLVVRCADRVLGCNLRKEPSTRIEDAICHLDVFLEIYKTYTSRYLRTGQVQHCQRKLVPNFDLFSEVFHDVISLVQPSA